VNQRDQWFFILILSAVSLAAHAQARPLPGADVQQIYQRLLPQIERIPIFDHHAHPGFFDDPDVDAMASPPGSAALRERDTNPELVAAAKALFAYPYHDLSPEHAKWLVQKKAELKPGSGWFSDVLDKLKIEHGVVELIPTRVWQATKESSHAKSSDQQVSRKHSLSESQASLAEQIRRRAHEF
jgi:hypothetical protein